MSLSGTSEIDEFLSINEISMIKYIIVTINYDIMHNVY